ncbi:MAG: peptidylprolyl isomerase, partial [Dehalococcoidia bacterium]|nr:peptidylprolyl isomerase [Dehalococcoidia bacterium]
RQKGPEIGLSASDDDIKEEMEKDNLPQNRVGTDLALTRVLTKKYTDQICLSKQPASVQAAEVEAMFLESKALVEDRKHKLELGENFTKMAGQLSMEPITKATSGYLGWIPEGYANYVLADLQSASFVDVVFRLQPGAFSDAIYDAGIEKEYGFWVLELLGKDDAKGYHGRGILLPTEQQAQEIREKLIDGGDWDELAKQYSQASGKDAGADLGWILPGSESTMMARLLAAQEPNKISAVLRDETASTSGGYWLVHVIDVEDRPLPSKISQEAAQDCLGEWVVGLQKDATIENLLDQQQKDLAAEKISKTRSK